MSKPQEENPTVTKYEPRYFWEPTWPGERSPHTWEPLQDYAMRIDGKFAGRIILNETHPIKGKWGWYGAIPPGYGDGMIMPNSGFAPTAREACRKVEEYWDRMCALRDRNRAE